MDLKPIKSAGQIAGIGGIAVVVLLYIFRDILSKTLPPDFAFKLYCLMIVMVACVAIAGIASWTWVSLKRKSYTGELTGGVNKGLLMHARPVDRKLIEATATGDVARVRLLLNEGANPNAKDTNGQSTLHYAAANNQNEIAKLLVAGGANLNATNRWGDRAVAVARVQNLSHLVTTLGQSSSQ